MGAARYAPGPAEQAVLRLLADGTPRTARHIIEALTWQKGTIHAALLRLRGEQFRRPALIALHATDPNVWAITATGRLAIQRAPEKGRTT